MDARLATLIRDYQARVAEAVAMLEAAGIPRPASTGEWAVANVPERGCLPRGFRFCTNRVGCEVHGAEWMVDFVFGDEGRIDGFDSARLYEFARRRFSGYGFKSEKEFSEAVQRAVEAGELRTSERGLHYLSDPALLLARGSAAAGARQQSATPAAARGPMPPGRRRFIAWWEIVFGAIGILLTALTFILSPSGRGGWIGVLNAILGVVFFAVCILFGVLLLRGDYRGIVGSAVLQGLQVIAVAILGGPYLVITAGPHLSLIIGSEDFRVSAGLELAFAQGILVTGPAWRVTINFLALAWTLMLLRYARERRMEVDALPTPEVGAASG